MKTRLCFFCEKEVPEKKVMCYGGPFALRHFCTCAQCFTKHRVLHWDVEPPINHYGTWNEIRHRFLKVCEDFAIDVDFPPEEPCSISDFLEWISEEIWEELGEMPLPDPPKVDGLGRRAVPLSEILKARETHPEQIPIDFPPTARCVLGKFDDRNVDSEVPSDELP